MNTLFVIDFEKLSSIIFYYQNYHLTKHKYHATAKSLVYFDDFELSKIRKANIKVWAKLRQETLSNSTINRHINFAKAAINIAQKDFEIILNNPFQNIKYQESDTIPNYLTPKEYKHLLKCALHYDNKDLHDFILLAVMTGSRQSELLTLTWDNVHLNKRHFIVRNTLSKSKRTMYKYLNDYAFEVLQERYKNRIGDYIFTNPKTNKNIKSFNKGWQLCKKRANINCRIHDLRHTYASWLVQKGVPIYTVKELLGHGDITSTMRYAHLDYATKVEAVNLLID